MPRTISLSANALRYVLPHVSSEASRPILNAVCIEPTGLAVATNGHSLVAHRTAAEPFAGEPVLIRFHKASAVLAKKVDRITVAIDGSGPAVVTLFDKLGQRIGAALADEVDGPFPDWRNVYRPREEAEPIAGICFDPSIAERFAVARDGVAHVRLTFDGETGAMLVRFGQEPDAIGLWMPCHDITPHDAPADPFGSARQAWHFIATRSAPATVGA